MAVFRIQRPISLVLALSLILSASSCDRGVKESPPVAEAIDPEVRADPPPPDPPAESLFLTKPTEEDVIASGSYNTAENVKAAETIIAALTPEQKKGVLEHMRQKNKIPAVKELRAISEARLAVTKLALELLCVREEIDPQIAKPQ